MSKTMPIENLYKIIKDRIKNKPYGSYVTSLVQSGRHRISQKVGEEAMELIIEASKDKINKKRIIEEASDLIFHLYILLAYFNVKPKEISEELDRRHQKCIRHSR